MLPFTPRESYSVALSLETDRQKKAVEGGATPQGDEAASLASTETSASADKRNQVRPRGEGSHVRSGL